MLITEKLNSNHYNDLFFSIEKASWETPEKIAVEDANHKLTYKQLKTQVELFSKNIQASGAVAGEVIGLYLDRSIDIIISMLACLRIKCVFFPISLNIPLDRLKYLVKDSGVHKIIAYPSIFPKLPNIKLIVPNYDTARQSDFVEEEVDPNRIAYLLYTSGSTGSPKGVLIEYYSMINLFTSLISSIGFSSTDVFLALTDYTFDVSLIELLFPLMLGATVVIADGNTIVDGHRIQEYLNQHIISVMQATPTTWELLLKSGWQNQGKFKILVGGEVFQTYLANQLKLCHGNVWNLYGPTETTMWSTAYFLNQTINTSTVPIGKPLHNMTALVLNEDISPATEGELYIGGQGVARCYLNRPELTASTFVTVDDTGQRYYKTGDIVRQLPDGNLLFLNRIDDQIKIGGVRIEPGEVESILMSHPMVQKAIVLAQGHGYCKHLVAFIEYNESKLYKDYRSYYENTTMQHWQDIYDITHQSANQYIFRHGINTIGWVSELTKEPISAEELHENLALLVNKLKQMNLKKVLEIGCGVGNVLRQIEGLFEDYTGIDISPLTIAQLEESLSDGLKNRCKLFASSIQDFKSDSKFSCIIVNSVIQYFPSSYYLHDVIELLINLTEEGGYIVFSDVRSSEMQELFFLLKDQQSINGSNKIKRYLKSKEEELILPTQFFCSLLKLFTRVTYVDIDVKRGNFYNELNIFRFDAVIHLDASIERRKTTYFDWDSVHNTLPELIEKAESEVIHITQVPNIFLEKPLQEIYSKNVKLPYVQFTDDEKEKVMLLTCQTINEKFSIYFIYDQVNPFTYLTVIFNPNLKDSVIRGWDHEQEITYPTREPFSPTLNDHLSRELGKYATDQLPPLMCPSHYYWVDRWPVTSNQKIDRKILASVKHEEIIDNDSKEKIDILRYLYYKVMNQTVSSCVPIINTGLSSLTMHHFIYLVNEELNSSLKFSDITDDLTMERLLSILD